MHARRARAIAALVLGVALASAGCHGGTAPRVAATESAGSACEQIDALKDLESSLETSPSFGGSGSLFYLVDVDQDLGYLRVTEKALARTTTSEGAALKRSITQLSSTLVALRDRLGSAIAGARATEQAAEAALETAAVCHGVDLRDPSGTKPTTVLKPKSASAGLAMAASKGCEASVRLWSAVGSADLTSEVSSASVASHISELTLPGPAGDLRNRLVSTLHAHAEALRRLSAIATGHAEEGDDDTGPLLRARSDLMKRIADTTRTCRSQNGDTARVYGGQPEPRRATVTVRPKWTGPLAALPHPEEFGSGFVVRWRNAHGDLEARIVTNNHVMDGAFEAEIVAADPKLAKAGHAGDAKDEPATWSATLIQSNPHDDVAILRLDGDAQRVFTEGFELRLAPAREEESVAAAGFPGIGARPSFQVTKGTVSNARFSTVESGENGLDVYVQHTAAIDPGNSGGPLLDNRGRILGMNTLKLVGRENVGLAIPTWRIQEALLRAEQTVSFDTMHAEASCDAAVAALAASHPVGQAASRFGLALYEWSQKVSSISNAQTYSDAMQDGSGDPVDDARRRAYGMVRAEVEREGGVRPFEACSELRAGEKPGTLVATFHTRKGTHTLTLAEEHAVIRVVGFD